MKLARFLHIADCSFAFRPAWYLELATSTAQEFQPDESGWYACSHPGCEHECWTDRGIRYHQGIYHHRTTATGHYGSSVASETKLMFPCPHPECGRLITVAAHDADARLCHRCCATGAFRSEIAKRANVPIESFTKVCWGSDGKQYVDWKAWLDVEPSHRGPILAAIDEIIAIEVRKSQDGEQDHPIGRCIIYSFPYMDGKRIEMTYPTYAKRSGGSTGVDAILRKDYSYKGRVTHVAKHNSKTSQESLSNRYSAAVREEFRSRNGSAKPSGEHNVFIAELRRNHEETYFWCSKDTLILVEQRGLLSFIIDMQTRNLIIDPKHPPSPLPTTAFLSGMLASAKEHFVMIEPTPDMADSGSPSVLRLLRDHKEESIKAINMMLTKERLWPIAYSPTEDLLSAVNISQSPADEREARGPRLNMEHFIESTEGSIKPGFAPEAQPPASPRATRAGHKRPRGQ